MFQHKTMKLVRIILGIIVLFTSCCYPTDEDKLRWQKEREEKVRTEFVADSIYKEKLKPFDYKVKFGLKSLKFDRIEETGVAGSFFLGCGSVSSYKHTHDEYYFYVVYKEGARLEHAPTHKVYIIETDSIEPCVIKVYPNVHWKEYDKFEKKLGGHSDGYTFSGYRKRYSHDTFDNPSEMDNWRIGDYLDGSPYIQLYVPVGTIIEEYRGYE